MMKNVLLDRDFLVIQDLIPEFRGLLILYSDNKPIGYINYCNGNTWYFSFELHGKMQAKSNNFNGLLEEIRRKFVIGKLSLKAIEFEYISENCTMDVDFDEYADFDDSDS